MTIYENTDRYLDKPVVEFRMGDTIVDRAVAGASVYRLTQDYDSAESQRDLLDSFLSQIDPATLDTLIVGAWSEAHEESPQIYLDSLIERRAELPALQSLFIGDMTSEECEISWIIQGDYKPLLAAFPELRSLRVRGSTDLKLTSFGHDHLQELAIECGGLPSKITNAIADSRLPALRRLELWLGDDNYGFDGDIKTYARLLNAIDASRLEYLGLRNAQISDALAIHLAAQPWLGKLKTLDLSMGIIGDEGAQALCESPYIAGLETLDLSHHYISTAWQTRLKTLSCKVVFGDPCQEEDGDRYIAVSE